MDFSPTEASTDLAGLARDILADQVTPDRLRAVAAADRFDRELWAALAEAGVLAAPLPESAGGNGFGPLEQCAVLVELGAAVAQVPYLETIATASAIARFGTAEQVARWVAPAATGALVLSAALAEEVNEDPANPGTVAEPVADGWRLTGSKIAVPYAPVADAIAVPARTPDGPVLFLVTPDDAGVRIEPQDLVDLGSAGNLELAGVVVPADRLVGGEVVDWLVAQATIGHCAVQLGVLGKALALTADYARTRVQFDRPLASFQAVTQRLADGYVDVEAVRLTLWQAAWRHAEGLPCHAEVATAKFWAAEAGHRVAHTAVHIHGGMGIDTDYPVHRYFVAAKRHEFDLGGATTQLRRLGTILATEPA